MARDESESPLKKAPAGGSEKKKEKVVKKEEKPAGKDIRNFVSLTNGPPRYDAEFLVLAASGIIEQCMCIIGHNDYTS
jgi:hypothetical protein